MDAMNLFSHIILISIISIFGFVEPTIAYVCILFIQYPLCI